MNEQSPHELEIRLVPYEHPDATALIGRVQDLYVERYGGPDDSPMEAGMFDPPTGAFFVGYLGGVPIATGAWRNSGEPGLGSTNTAEIKRMYIVPEVQRGGYGRRMLAHLERTAREAGYDVIVLATGNRQPEAIAMYLATGYVEVEKFGHYKDESLTVCFAKRL